MAEKNCFDMTKLILQIMYMCHCGAVDKGSLARADKPGSTPGDAVSCLFVPFFFLSCLVSFFNIIFPFGLFSFILTADPADHALGSIGKGISKALDLHTGQALSHKP